MDFRFTPEQDAWRAEVRSTIESLITPELRAETESGEDVGPGPAGKRFMRELGARGLLGVSWPREYGGLGRSLMDQYIFSEEIGGFGGLYTNGTATTMVGPTIMNVGSDEQRAEWLPKMLSGEVECALGYTEPGAGTDLAGLQTRAVADGDDYVINGQKLFTSAAHFSSHVWLLGAHRHWGAKASRLVGVPRPDGRGRRIRAPALAHGRRAHKRGVLRRRPYPAPKSHRRA